MTSNSSGNAGRTYRLAFVLTVSLFALWGAAQRLYDTLEPSLVKILALHSFEAGVTQSLVCLGYCMLAIPAALFMRKFGYKAGIVCGLSLFGVGSFLFYPAAEGHNYAYFVCAVLVIAFGLTFLDTSANPMVVRMGSSETSVQRLNFAQSLNPVGLLLGVYIGRWLILSDLKLPISELGHAVVRPFIVIGAGVLLLAFVVDRVKFPAVVTERVMETASVRGEFRTLLSRPLFLFGVTAQFFYIAAQVGVWTFAARYAEAAMPNSSAWASANVLLYSLFIFMAGRFIGTALMSWIRPDRLLVIYVGVAVVLTAIAAGAGGWSGLICVAATSFFMSIMYPTIFAFAIKDLGPLTKLGSAFQVMAAGGSVAALALMNLLCRYWSVQYVMLVPSLSLAMVMAFAIANQRAARSPSPRSAAALFVK